PGGLWRPSAVDHSAGWCTLAAHSRSDLAGRGIPYAKAWWLAVDDTEVSYGDFLFLDALLGLQRESEVVRDAHFFFAVHQVFELQFKIILYELDLSVCALASDDVGRALYSLRRVRAVGDVMVGPIVTPRA